MNLSSSQAILLLLIIFLTIYATIGIYNLVLYFVIKRKVLLEYCLLILALICYTLVSMLNYLPVDINYFGLSVSAAAFLSFGALIYTKSFLGIDRYAQPRLNKAYEVLMIVSIVIIIAQSLSLVLNLQDVIDYATSLTAAILPLLSIALFIYSATVLWKNPRAKLFVYNCIPLLVGPGIYISIWFNAASPTEGMRETLQFQAYLVLFGSFAIHLILYSIFLGYDLRNLEGK